jgi:hypothetical protein
MTVGELIEKLKEVDPDLRVASDGCDCYGWATDIEEIYASSVGSGDPCEKAILISR